jgi:hypothetical protein
MWICTDRGVVRFDGYRYQVFNKENGLLDNVVFKMMEDFKGRIWFITYSRQLCYYEKGSIKPYKFNHLIKKHVAHNYAPFSWASIDPQDNLYFSVNNRPIIRISPKGKTVTYPLDHDIHFTKIYNRWMFSAVPVKKPILNPVYFKFDGKECKINAVGTAKDFCVERQEVEQFGNTIYITNRATIYTSGGASRQLESLITGTYKQGKDLWVSTFKGIYLFRNVQKRGLAKPEVFLKPYSVTGVCRDREGGYWFSTLENGVFYCPDIRVLNASFSEDPGSNNLYDVYLDKRMFLVSNVRGCYEVRSGKVISEMEKNISQIAHLGNTVFVSDEKPLVTNFPGIKRMKTGSGSWCRESDTSFLLTGSGIMRYTISGDSCMLYDPIFDPSVFRFVKHRFEPIVLDRKKNLYIADLVGMYRLENKVFRPYRPLHFPKDIRVYDLAYSDDWGLLAGTAGGGVYMIKNDRVVSVVNERNGLIFNYVNRLYLDEKNQLYVCTNKGVSRIYRDKEGAIRVDNLTTFQGLRGLEVNACFSYDHTLYLATRRGLSKVDDSYHWFSGNHKKQIQVLDIFVNGKKIADGGRSLVLDHHSKVIRIRLASTNFKTRGKTPYKYRLTGNSSWNIGYNGEILLLNPAYDRFDIEIRYKNENGVWSDAYFLTAIEITPPFYQEIWFYGLISVGFLIIVIVILFRRIHAINRKAEIRRNMELLEQKALLAQMNPHFIFNSLNSIQSFLLYDENELAERYLLKLSKLIRLTLVNSRETEITLEKEIESLKMYLELEQMRFKNRFEFQFEIALSNQDIQRSIPPMLIQPFVENSIIHGFKKLKEGGMITISFRDITDGILSVEVMDNGVGYENALEKIDQEHKSYGTKITLERLDLFKQRYRGEFSYTISSIYDSERYAAGTIVKMTIPVI